MVAQRASVVVTEPLIDALSVVLMVARQCLHHVAVVKAALAHEAALRSGCIQRRVREVEGGDVCPHQSTGCGAHVDGRGYGCILHLSSRNMAVVIVIRVLNGRVHVLYVNGYPAGWRRGTNGSGRWGRRDHAGGGFIIVRAVTLRRVEGASWERRDDGWCTQPPPLLSHVAKPLAERQQLLVPETIQGRCECSCSTTA